MVVNAEAGVLSMDTDQTELQTLEVGRIRGRFIVPDYQRGYRWGEVEVRHLLDDIYGSEGAYYLQPVVVKTVKRASGDGDDPHEPRWELVDGQQRLTTLYLILQYIQEHLPKAELRYSIEYETRPDSAEFLKNPTVAGSLRNIDFFHIYQADRLIREWFESKDDASQAAIDFRTALTKRVFVIWYEAAELSSIDLFTRLNVGRIPLTDAELVKALILSRSRASAGKADRALGIAAQWDGIERDLRDSELWAFATGRSEDDATRIGLLLDTKAGGPTGRERPLFHTFEWFRQRVEAEPDNVGEVWEEVVDLYSLLRGWFDDRDLFHKIGYLVATRAASERAQEFAELVALSEGRTKTCFEKTLNERIRDRLKLPESAVLDLHYRHSKALPVLLLMNVETVRGAKNSSERYSFSAHATRRWSLEHIHAQNAEELNRAEQQTQWLQSHRDALTALDLDDAELESLVSRIDAVLADVTTDAFRRTQRDITELFSRAEGVDAEDVDAIVNLALLDSGTNSALSNSVFEVKRQMIIQRDRRGEYIPVCTRNAFLKYYTDSAAQQLHYWGSEDREGYGRAMVEKIRPYLLPEEPAE